MLLCRGSRHSKRLVFSPQGQTQIKMSSSSSSPPSSGLAKSFEDLKWENKVVSSLPIDPIKDNYVRSPVPKSIFSLVEPTPVENPRIVCVSEEVMSIVGLDPSIASSSPDPTAQKTLADYLCGNRVPSGARPAAHCYCGHQFGYFSGQLGDGATMYLGDVINPKGERWEIQFKGAGKTPYSRSADGRKVLRSSLREFLCSEHMNALGVPTTRAMSVVTSDSTVVRDIFYTGNPILEPSTIIIRVAPSFFRFGSFEICKQRDRHTGRAGPSSGHLQTLRSLLDFTISEYYPHLWNEPASSTLESLSTDESDEASQRRRERTIRFFDEVVQKTATLVACWQTVGWCHGVLNTDNCSIMGLTIDYGPYGFMQSFNPQFICNSSDEDGRYTYEAQPEIMKWNCIKLAEALAPFVNAITDFEPSISKYDAIYEAEYESRMAKKLGLTPSSSSSELGSGFMDLLEKTGADFTNCFRVLGQVRPSSYAAHESENEVVIQYMMDQCCTATTYNRMHKPKAMDPRQLAMMKSLLTKDPAILRANQIDPAMLEAEIKKMEASLSGGQQSQLTECQKLESDRQIISEWIHKYQQKVDEVLGGGDGSEEKMKEREMAMNKANPKFVLRNQVAQRAIDAAAAGDFATVKQIFNMLTTPFDEHPEMDPFFSAKADEDATKLRVS